MPDEATSTSEQLKAAMVAVAEDLEAKREAELSQLGLYAAGYRRGLTDGAALVREAIARTWPGKP